MRIQRREGKFYNDTDGIGYDNFMDASNATLKPAKQICTTVARQERVWVDADENPDDFGYWETRNVTRDDELAKLRASLNYIRPSHYPSFGEKSQLVRYREAKAALEARITEMEAR